MWTPEVNCFSTRLDSIAVNVEEKNTKDSSNCQAQEAAGLENEKTLANLWCPAIERKPADHSF